MQYLPIEYQLTRSVKRKSVALSVKEGQVFVRAPWYVKASTIDAFVRSKRQWVNEKLAEHAVLKETREVAFEANGKVYFQGQLIDLVLVSGKKQGSELVGNQLIISLRELPKLLACQELLAEKIKQQVFAFYKLAAEQHLCSRTEELADICQLMPRKIQTKKYRARWGSCDSRGTISLNYLLMTCPDWVIDYVIIHELCHLQHFDHSPKFWALVAQYCPNVSEAKAWLKQHNYLIRL